MKLPAEILDDRIAIVGTSGSGKTVTGKLGVEALLEQGARVCIVDPLGVWWGLRSNAKGDGVGHPITIFGGEHGDLPISESAGSIVAEAVAAGDFSCIVDLSELPSQAKRRKFMKDFAETLYAKNREPLHLVLDEADLWVPQKPIEDIAHILGARIDEIVRRGRVRGFVPWLITQRPAVIHKDVLSQLDTLIAMKLTSSQDRNALDAWIEGQADKAEQKRIYGALPSLSVGEGFLWSPGHGMLKQVQFSMIKTFDSSRQPKRGERIKAPSKRAAVDLEGLRAKLATVEEETKANDPKTLRAEIAKLKAAAGKPAPAAPTVIEGTTKADLDAAHGLGLLEGETRAREKFIEQMDRAEKMIQDKLALWVGNAFIEARGTMLAHQVTRERKLADGGARAAFERAKAAAPATLPPVPVRNARPAPRLQSSGSGEKMAAVERKFLIALAQRGALPRNKIAIFAGYSVKSRHVDNTLAALRSKGWAEGGGDSVQITQAGLDAVGAFDPLPTGEDLRRYWLGQMGKAASSFLAHLIAIYPRTIARNDLAEATGYSTDSRHVDNTLAVLRSHDLATGSGQAISAAAHLFED